MLPVVPFTQTPDPQTKSLLFRQLLSEHISDIISRVGLGNFYDLNHIRMTCRKLYHVMDNKDLLANIFRLTFPSWTGPAPVDFKDAYSIVCRSISNVKKGVYGSSTFVTDTSVRWACSLLIFRGELIAGSLDPAIRIFDLKTRECRLTLTEHPGEVLALTVVDKQLFSIYKDQTIKTWNLETGECLGTLYSDGENSQSRTISGGKLFSGFMDGRIEVRDVKTGKPLMVLQGHEAGVCILNTYQGKLFSGDTEGVIKIWELESGQCLLTPKTGRFGAVETFAFLGTTFFASFEHNPGILSWKISAERLLKVINLSYVKSLAVMGDNLISYSGFDSGDNLIKVWNPETRECLRTLRPYDNLIDSIVAFEEKLFLCTDDGVITLWDYLVADNVVLKEIVTLLKNSIPDSDGEEYSVDEFKDNMIMEAKDRFSRMPQKLQQEILFPHAVTAVHEEDGPTVLAQSIEEYLKKHDSSQKDLLVDQWLDGEGPSKRQKTDTK